MQDLRTISDAPAPTYQDPLYLEDQVPHRRPPIGEWTEEARAVPRGMASSRPAVAPPRARGKPGSAGPRPSDCVRAQLCLPASLSSTTGYRSGGLQDSDTEDECWSDTEVVPQPSVRPREKPLGRTQSLRVVKRKPPVREVGGEEGTRGASCPGGRLSPDLSRGACSLSPQGTTRSLKVRTRKKTTPSDMDS